jgi:superfamily II DNA helicase RecQ
MGDTCLEQAIFDGLTSILPQMTQERIMTPKEEQCEAIAHMFNGEDTVCVLPTGYGKSMTFFSLPALHSLLTGKLLTVLYYSCRSVN